MMFLSVVLVMCVCAIPILAVVGLVYWGNNIHQRRLQAWNALAESKRLRFTGHTIEGYLHGQQVRVATETRGSGDSRTTYTVVSSSLAAPLDLGLRITRSGWLGDMFERGYDIPLGHRHFDPTFRVSGDEEHRVRAAVGPALQNMLVTHLSRGPTFALHDSGMRIERSGTISDARWLGWALEVVSRGAAKLERARRQIPVASALAQHRHAWQQYAHGQGLQLSTTPLCIWGRMEDSEVYVYTVRTGVKTYKVDVSLRFREMLHIGLHIGPQGVFDKIAIFFGSQDQRFSDALFDKTFRVRSADVERSEQLLTPQIRQHMLHLHQHLGPITVNDVGISVRLPYVPHDPAVMPRIVHALVMLSDAIQRANSDDLEAGPYR